MRKQKVAVLWQRGFEEDMFAPTSSLYTLKAIASLIADCGYDVETLSVQQMRHIHPSVFDHVFMIGGKPVVKDGAMTDGQKVVDSFLSQISPDSSFTILVDDIARPFAYNDNVVHSLDVRAKAKVLSQSTNIEYTSRLVPFDIQSVRYFDFAPIAFYALGDFRKNLTEARKPVAYSGFRRKGKQRAWEILDSLQADRKAVFAENIEPGNDIYLEQTYMKGVVTPVFYENMYETMLQPRVIEAMLGGCIVLFEDKFSLASENRLFLPDTERLFSLENLQQKVDTVTMNPRLQQLLLGEQDTAIKKLPSMLSEMKRTLQETLERK